MMVCTCLSHLGSMRTRRSFINWTGLIQAKGIAAEFANCKQWLNDHTFHPFQGQSEGRTPSKARSTTKSLSQWVTLTDLSRRSVKPVLSSLLWSKMHHIQVFQCHMGLSMVSTIKLFVSQPTPNNCSNALIWQCTKIPKYKVLSTLPLASAPLILLRPPRTYQTLSPKTYFAKMSLTTELCLNKLTVVAKIRVVQQLNSQLGLLNTFRAKNEQVKKIHFKTSTVS